MTFLRKVQQGATSLDDHYRGISLLGVVQKWYMSAVIIVAQRHTLKLWPSNVVIFGRGNKLGADQAVSGMQLMLARANELRGLANMDIFEGDISRAYDNLTLELVSNALENLEFDPILIAAILRENVGLQVLPSFWTGDAHHDIAVQYVRATRVS